MTVRAVVVDDERLGREKVLAMLAAHEDVQVVGECANGAEAVAEIRKQKPDLVFLDVEMPGSSAFDVLRKLRGERMPAIVFVTAHDEYAIRAFEVEAVDYLLKPFDRRRFNEALRRARKRIENGGAALPEKLWSAIEQLADKKKEPAHWTRFVVRTRDRMLFVPTSDVDWIEAEGKYVRLHAGSAAHLIREPITEVESRLDPAEFVRIHRKTIVNLRQVTEMYRAFRGDYMVVLKTGQKLTVSRRYWSKVKHLGGT